MAQHLFFRNDELRTDAGKRLENHFIPTSRNSLLLVLSRETPIVLPEDHLSCDLIVQGKHCHNALVTEAVDFRKGTAIHNISTRRPIRPSQTANSCGRSRLFLMLPPTSRIIETFGHSIAQRFGKSGQISESNNVTAKLHPV